MGACLLALVCVCMKGRQEKVEERRKKDSERARERDRDRHQPLFQGYGQSTGKPSEKNLYADIEASWHALRSRYGVSPENIILYGQSIGTVPTVDLASRYEVSFTSTSVQVVGQRRSLLNYT